MSNDASAPKGVLGDPLAMADQRRAREWPTPTAGMPSSPGNGQPGENVRGSTGAPAPLPPPLSGSPEVAGGFTPLDPFTVLQPDPTARRDFIRPLEAGPQPSEGV